MAHAVKIWAGAKPGAGADNNANKWDENTLRERINQGVYGSGFERVLAGDKSDPGQATDDQETPIALKEDAIGDRPDHYYGLYRTADSENIDAFIDAFVGNVFYDARWFVIEPHDCTHDRDEGGPCEVYDGEDQTDKIVERGNAPESFSYE